MAVKSRNNVSAGGAEEQARPQGRPYVAAGESLVRITLPPGTPDEARIAVQRLVELTSILARRCAQLQNALDSRVVIEQAKGILAARLDLPVDQTFSLLRRSARSHRLSLHELAAEVVESNTVPPRVVRELKHATNGQGPPRR